MAWFGEGFTSLKGQISNFTKEIVANNVAGIVSSDASEIEENSTSPEYHHDYNLEALKAHCKHQDEEVARLKAEIEKVRSHRAPRDRRISEEATLECEEDPIANTELPLVSLDEAGADSFLGQENVPKEVKVEDEVASLRSRLRKTFQEKVLMEHNCLRLEKEVTLLTRQVAEDRQAQADVEARRVAGTSKDCSQSTQTDTGGSTTPSDVTTLSQENARLKQERALLRMELVRMTRAVQDLESQVAVSQDENANLSTGMEELDIQHQEAIEQIIVLKDSTQKRYEMLLADYEELNNRYDGTMKMLQEKNKSNCKDSESQTNNSDVESPKNSHMTVDLSAEIKNMITTEIPDKYFETSRECANGLETVAAVEKMLSHTMARVEASEGKVRDVTRELEIRESDVQELEDENKVLRLKIDELKEQRNNLPVISENCEDVEVLENKIQTLENEISIHREVRSNLEVELNNSRSEIESLFRQLQTTEAVLKNHDNLQTENSKFKEREHELIQQLKNAEQGREEMLLEINHLQRTVDEQEKVVAESHLSNSKIEELVHLNEQLQLEIGKVKENAVSHLKLEEELQQEKSLRMIREEEKEQLYSELTKLEMTEEHNKMQSVELEKEQSIRAHLDTENKELQQKIVLLQDIENDHLKVIEDLQNELDLKRHLEENLDMMHSEIKRLEKECESQSQLLEAVTHKSDVKLKDLKSLNSCLTQKCVKLEKEMLDLSEKSDSLQIEIDSKDRKLCEIILEKSVSDKELDELNVTCNSLERDLLQLKMSLFLKEDKLVKELVDLFSPFFESLSLENTDSQTLMKELAKQTVVLHEHNKELTEEKEALSNKVTSLLCEVNDNSDSMLKLTKEFETLQAEKHSLEDRLRNTNNSVSKGNQTDQPDIPEITQENYDSVHKQLEVCQRDCKELEEKYNKMLSSSEQSLNHAHEQLRNLNVERQQLIESVQMKHTECLNYHAEIQRLCGELTKAEALKSTAILQLEKKLEEKEEQLTLLEGSSARQVTALTEQVATLQHQLDYVSQLLRVTDRQEAEGQPASDSPSAKVQPIKPEVEEKEARKLDEVYESLQQEQLRNKYLQDEVSEQHEKEASLVRELERLRSHLVAVEENYTQEMLRAEVQVSELTQRLTHAEERTKSSTTAYTSASIRANQQVEALGSQMRLISEQKEKLSTQLVAAEDKVHKQAAALTNLQIVLEQFQRDKERDVAMENERIRQNLNQANNKIFELNQEIKAVQFQLKEAKEGLNAASRLTEKLDQQSQTISELSHQVAELTEKLRKAEERIQTASTSVEGKVDRCLVRNLLVGYLGAPPSSQQQALGIIASVLDFTQEDRQRSGLDPNTSLKHQSLSEAFVRFLENESRPQPQLRLSLQETEGTRSRKTSVSEVGLQPARRISGSVLKDVLKQDI